MTTPNDPILDEPGAPGAERGHIKTKAPTRRIVVGLAAGLAATVGAGFAVQSVDAANIDDMATGAQLPWDESREIDRPGNERLDSMRDGVRDRLHDRMHDRMHANDGPGLREGARPGDRFERMGGRGLAGPRELIAVAADELGVTLEELVDGLKSGKSIADIAGEKNVPIQNVIDAIVEVVVEDATERITDLVNRSIDLPRSDAPNS